MIRDDGFKNYLKTIGKEYYDTTDQDYEDYLKGLFEFNKKALDTAKGSKISGSRPQLNDEMKAELAVDRKIALSNYPALIPGNFWEPQRIIEAKTASVYQDKQTVSKYSGPDNYNRAIKAFGKLHPVRIFFMKLRFKIRKFLKLHTSTNKLLKYPNRTWRL